MFFIRPIVSIISAIWKGARVCGVVKGFQIACNLAGPLGDVTGTGDQSSGKVVHRDLAGPLGDLTGTGDQSSGKVVHRYLAGPLGDLTGTGDQPCGKVVLVIRCRTSQGNNQQGIRATREDGLVKRVSLKSTLSYRR